MNQGEKPIQQVRLRLGLEYEDAKAAKLASRARAWGTLESDYLSRGTTLTPK